MGAFAKYLRRNKGGGGKNVVNDKAEKAKFAEELRQQFDPTERETQERRRLEEMVLKSAREPTVKEVLEELARQAKRLRDAHPDKKLVCFCGAYAYALLANVRSYPEVVLGIQIEPDRQVPPWDTVVMYLAHRGRAHGKIL